MVTLIDLRRRLSLSARCAAPKTRRWLRSPKKGDRQMDLRQLRYFIVVAEERHITRAAARLGMEQPPLSVQIKALEKELGISLLTRHPRGVELTAGGKALLDGARALLADLER